MPDSYSNPSTKLRVLLLETDEGIRDAVICYLEMEEMDVRAVSDEEEFLHLLDAYCPHVIIIDYHPVYPITLNLCDRIKHSPAYMHLPVILCSTQLDTVQKKTVFADAIIVKPFDFSHLLVLIRKLARP